MGNGSASAGRRLIYAMRISEVLDFDDYFRDTRFAAKKPRAGTWRERCGDNIVPTHRGATACRVTGKKVVLDAAVATPRPRLNAVPLLNAWNPEDGGNIHPPSAEY
jgi:hypothetical protein